MKIPRTAHECTQALGCNPILIDEQNVECLGAYLEGFQMRHACTHERTRISAPDPLTTTEHCLECPAYRVLFSVRQMYAVEKDEKSLDWRLPSP